ncbi:uncharacterized protein C8orf34 homolog isoform X2 [Vombatus ursinus]|uniref:uncharacterized protein C8orf34 homolog isoform X2 n=1 Tax=Vombatus ursinus TaxID=29139 RepID=UPI000FFD4CC3|nr:uncharacterized protein C8orf34 homolog isoform X2 [Vombatus ursinus]XP_027733016.1 uncharacterized protein C8orf34 homolog isoform X2 [Vombatus ursinus]
MASHQQTRIQAYLEKNKIGPLFEELMTKLITETPDQPIPFLIDHLQSKQGPRSQLQRTLSGSAALWAESETSEHKGTRRDFRSYDKPWQVNAKKPKKSKSDLAVSNISPPSPESKSLPRSVEHPKWNWRIKPESHDFDELNHILQESKKLGKALENLSRSIAISDELDKDTMAFNSTLLRPRVIGEWVGREENDADPLAAEMLQPPIPRSKNEQWGSEDSTNSPAGSLKMEPKSKGLKQQQQQHKKLLAAMLSQDSFESIHSPTPSVTEEDIDNEDDAMELLEDLDDLRMEGVTTLMPSGSKFNPTRTAHLPEPQAKVTLNICSRCARLQGDNLAEGTEEVSQLLHTPEEAVPDSVETDSLCPTEAMEDDEFESASQIIGPCPPVWDLANLDATSESSPSLKILKDSLAVKELQSMEKHLADIEKDLELWEEGRLARNPSSMHNVSVASDLQGNLQSSPSLSTRPPEPSQTGKIIQLQLQGNKSPPSVDSRVRVSSISNSRPHLLIAQTNRPQTLTVPGSRPVTPNSLLTRPLTPSNQEKKERIINIQRSKSVPSKSQIGRALSTPSGLVIPISGDKLTSTTLRSSLSEGEASSRGLSLKNFMEDDDSLKHLQLVHQPWILPSDTESEGIEAEQGECM